MFSSVNCKINYGVIIDNIDIFNDSLSLNVIQSYNTKIISCNNKEYYSNLDSWLDEY